MRQLSAQLKRYLNDQEPYYGNRDIHSVLEFLYWHYTNCNQLKSGTIDESFHEINETMAHMTLQQQDIIIDKVNELCGEFEKHGFCEGFHIGARLMAELEQRDAEGKN